MKRDINAKTCLSLIPKFITALLLLVLFPALLFAQGADSERINLGLYGGASNDLTYDTAYRLFSAVESPGSLFYSDDTCKTWTQAFPVDSLEYDGNQRGWSGGRRVVTNLAGWVGVRTMEAGGTYTSSVISYLDGDSGSFQTAFDGTVLSSINPAVSGNRGVTAVGLSDKWFYVGMDNYLLRTNDTSTYGMHNILFDLDTVSIADSCTMIQYIAVANTASGFPLLIVTVPDNTQPPHGKGKLLLFDGDYFSEIAPPTDATGGGSTLTFDYQKVWIHPVDTTLDTVIVSTKERSLNTVRVYISYNGGTSWSNITPSSGTNWPMQNADYYPQWEATMTVSHGMRLSFPGGMYSSDLGANWTSGVMPDNAVAFSPDDPELMIGSKNKGPMVSTDAGGSFTKPDNDGHAAVSITKIAQRNHNIYYVATKAGLGYTTAYKDTTVQGVAQWQSPYGDFPISGVGGDNGVTAVDIAPDDSLHIVVGCSQGFYYSFNGPASFTLVTPSDWDSGSHRDYTVTDVQFITGDTLVAVSGTGSNVWPSLLFDYGNIWLSTDGGVSWTKSHPTDGGETFEQGNTVAVSYGNPDTVIFLGCGYWDHSFPTVNGQLWKSTDFGVTWSFINAGPASQMPGSVVDSLPVYDLDIYPGSADTLFLAAGENLDYAFAKSTDGGITYSYISISPEGAFSSVMVHPDDPDIVSVAARRDLWRYNTVLNSSSLVFEGLPGEFIPDLEYGSVLMGTTTGLFKLTETPGSVTTIWRGEGYWSDATRWSNGVPYNLSNAVIDSGQVNVDINGEANNLDLNPATALTVDSGYTVALSGDFIIKSDDKSDASYIDDGTITVAGTIKVQRYISEDQWHYFTPPVTSATANPFTGMWVKYWDEGMKDWVYISNAGEPLLSGKGYATWSPGGGTGNAVVQYTGVLNTGDYTPSVSLSGDTALDYGWNLVGNAYPSSFNWEDASLTKTNIDNTIYYWNGTQYVTYNGTTHIGSSGVTQFVPPQQGFFIHANDASPVFTVTQQSRTHYLQQFMNSPSFTEGLFRLFVTGNGYNDETILLFNDDASNGFDSDYDAYKLYGIDEAPQLYSYGGGEKMAMNVQPFEGPIETVNLGFEAGISGMFTITADGQDNFPGNTSILLEDKKLNKIIDLRIDSTYTFNASAGDDPDRFVLYFNNIVNVNNLSADDDDIKFYLDDNDLIVSTTNGELISGDVSVYDILGRVRYHSNLNGSNAQRLSMNLDTGVYVAVLKLKSKLYIRKLKMVIK